MNPVQNWRPLGLFLSLFFLFLVTGLDSRLLNAQPVTPENPIEGNIDDIARAILTYFPKAVGEVVAINPDRIEVDMGREHPIAAGILLTVFREGETFLHPLTGLPLGKYEDKIGTLEALRFHPPYLIALPIEGQEKIVVGDRVRISATRIPLAVSVSSESDHAFLMNELVSALTDTGRFRIKTLSPGASLNAARQEDMPYHIRLATAHIQERFSMQLEIQNTHTGKVLAALDVLINQSDESDLILEHLQYQLFEQRQKK